MGEPIEIPGFVIYGPPATKKTSNRVISIPKKGARACFACGHRPGFPKVLPSEQYEAWLEEALHQMILIRAKLARRGVNLPIAGAVSIEALIYRPTNTTGDVNGYQQAIGDMLQAARVLVNDRQIEDWDGSRRRVDPAKPRVEIYILVLEPRAVQVGLEY
jgi:Holliday junction resolvase RusA-like endonuclease